MVLGRRLDGESQIVSVPIRKTIQSIKEIVGNHSDADIYATLKETNMDPNETAQKLLHQGLFFGVSLSQSALHFLFFPPPIIWICLWKDSC
ncbi:hypothetical protein COCNU_03G003680 [Cocos nucifera]|uniref:GBF-interacting protein 1 N-terminal domain-containing protein n=1 Tax=Cocos nucifera TaxID=13894 RepID=A0A8K0I2D3_COCNU|nr:hypothetical protein COCNU_03G003680 [Cocos nucifera]